MTLRDSNSDLEYAYRVMSRAGDDVRAKTKLYTITCCGRDAETGAYRATITFFERCGEQHGLGVVVARDELHTRAWDTELVRAACECARQLTDAGVSMRRDVTPDDALASGNKSLFDVLFTKSSSGK